jgi:hypothetical protein
VPWEDWSRREPSDAERLQVNRKGWELLYFVQPPGIRLNVTISLLKDELCDTLQITHPGRLCLTSGPFLWDSKFNEDGRPFHETYFTQDMMIDSRHMNTAGGLPLMYVLEEHPP